MEDLDISPSAAELAATEAELPEWDRLAVRDHWEAVIAEELGAPQVPASPFAWSSLGPGEKERVRRYERREDAKVLRLITSDVDAASVVAAPCCGEVA